MAGSVPLCGDLDVCILVVLLIAVSVRVGTQLQRHRSLICESLDDHLKGTM